MVKIWTSFSTLLVCQIFSFINIKPCVWQILMWTSCATSILHAKKNLVMKEMCNCDFQCVLLSSIKFWEGVCDEISKVNNNFGHIPTLFKYSWNAENIFQNLYSCDPLLCHFGSCQFGETLCETVGWDFTHGLEILCILAGYSETDNQKRFSKLLCVSLAMCLCLMCFPLLKITAQKYVDFKSDGYFSTRP